jgi:hypothetical protein
MVDNRRRFSDLGRLSFSPSRPIENGGSRLKDIATVNSDGCCYSAFDVSVQTVPCYSSTSRNCTSSLVPL